MKGLYKKFEGVVTAYLSLKSVNSVWLKTKVVIKGEVFQYHLVGYLNGFFAPREGNLNKPIFKSSIAGGGEGGGMLKLQVD